MSSLIKWISSSEQSAQRLGRTDPLRRPRFLCRLVELYLLGPIRSRLEPPSPQLPPPPRLSRLHHDLQSLPQLSHLAHLPALGLRARAGHGRHLPEGQGIPSHDADGPAAPGHAKPDALSERKDHSGKYDLLARHLCRPQSALYSVSTALKVRTTKIPIGSAECHTDSLSELAFTMRGCSLTILLNTLSTPGIIIVTVLERMLKYHTLEKETDSMFHKRNFIN